MNNQPQRVLLIDDDDSVRLVICQLLIHAGFHVERAGSAAEALRYLDEQRASQPVDVVITDLHMPGMDGRTLHQEISNRWPDLAEHVILITGDVHDDHAHAVRDDRRMHVLAKPFTRAALVEAIKAVLSRHPHFPQSESLTQ